jgi:ATP-binding protein involved in chromosome partitioning
VESALFEGNTEGMCEVLGLPLIGRVPFDRSFARTFDKGDPLLDESHPTVKHYQEIAKKVQSLLDYKKVLAEKL